jgi:hypothetical protein
MDGSTFDRWTRRRVGLLAGGVVAALLRLSALDALAARKRRKKKKKRHGKSAGATCKATDEICTGPEECCSGACANLPSSETAVCRRETCVMASEDCLTHGDCCAGGCSDNLKVCFG